jgi:spore coat protein SA
VRICLIFTEKLPVPPVRGGAIQIYIDGVLPYLRAEHHVTVICRRDPLLPDREEVDGVRYERVAAGGRLGIYIGNAVSYLRTQPAFDVVILYNRPAATLPILRSVPSARLILSMHNDMFAPDRLPTKEAEAVLQQVGRVVTVSDYVQRGIAQLYPDQAHKLITIRSGVDIERFQPGWQAGDARKAVRERLGLSEAPLLLHVSRLSEKKGNDLVVAAMAEVKKSHPVAQLVMVGSTRYGSPVLDAFGQGVHSAAAKLGAHILGFVPPADLPDLFLASDLFINASQWQEPLARVHYEAMAAGLPIITTDRGGNREVMEVGGNGLIATPYNSVDGFVLPIRDLLDHPEKRAQMGRRGRTLAEERYTWARVARELLDLIHGR